MGSERRKIINKFTKPVTYFISHIVHPTHTGAFSNFIVNLYHLFIGLHKIFEMRNSMIHHVV